jgi:hypothetical protein
LTNAALSAASPPSVSVRATDKRQLAQRDEPGKQIA